MRIWFLLHSDEAHNDGDGIDFGCGELEGLVVFVVGDDEDVRGIVARLDALDERPLLGIEDIGLVPLEEDVFERHLFASHYVA